MEYGRYEPVIQLIGITRLINVHWMSHMQDISPVTEGDTDVDLECASHCSGPN